VAPNLPLLKKWSKTTQTRNTLSQHFIKVETNNSNWMFLAPPFLKVVSTAIYPVSPVQTAHVADRDYQLRSQ
jgi:hypothetical protein